MKFKKYFFFKLNFIISFLLFFSFEVSSCFFEEDDEEKIYIGVESFDSTLKLDEHNNCLSFHEINVTKEITKENSSKNNIVVGSITISLKNNKDEKLRYLNKEICDMEEEEEKLQIFESSLKLETRKLPETLNQYSFQKDIGKIYDFINYIYSIWEKDNITLSCYEEEILKKFKTLQTELWNRKESLKNFVTIAALTPYTQELSKIALNLIDDIHKDSHSIQSDTLRQYTYTSMNNKPSSLLEKIKTEINTQQTKIKKAEKEFNQAVINLLHPFWHSEQRLISFLLNESSNGFWDSFSDEIEEGEKIVEVFLHIHSHYNMCPVCRRTLFQVSEKDSILWEHLRSKFNIETDFNFKILGSFRTHYKVKEKWVPHIISRLRIDEEKNINDNTCTNFYLKKIMTGDEEDENKNYAESFKKYPNFLNYSFDYLFLEIDDLDKRIKLLEKRLELNKQMMALD